MKLTRKKYQASLKAKIALASLQEEQSCAQLARRFGIHVSQIHKWRNVLKERAFQLFEEGAASESCTSDREELLKKIGELTIERDFLSDGLRRSR